MLPLVQVTRQAVYSSKPRLQRCKSANAAPMPADTRKVLTFLVENLSLLFADREDFNEPLQTGTRHRL